MIKGCCTPFRQRLLLDWRIWIFLLLLLFFILEGDFILCWLILFFRLMIQSRLICMNWNKNYMKFAILSDLVINPLFLLSFKFSVVWMKEVLWSVITYDSKQICAFSILTGNGARSLILRRFVLGIIKKVLGLSLERAKNTSYKSCIQEKVLLKQNKNIW